MTSLINNGGPAFPAHDTPGMSVRQAFAAAALPAIIEAHATGQMPVKVAESGYPDTLHDALAVEAFKMADAMIRAGS